MTDTNQLPPLPEPEGVIVVGTQALRGFTADQMRAYALQSRAQLAQGEPVTDEQCIRAAVAAMPYTNPGVADDLIEGHTMHTEAEDIVAIWRAASGQPAQVQPVEVSDEQIQQVIDSIPGAWRASTLFEFARAILALRPAAQEVQTDRQAREAEQRARMTARFACRAPGEATADFDLPAPNDAPQQATPEPNPWREAVEEELTILHASMPTDPREAVKKLVALECQIALDPDVSQQAAALVQRGRDEATPEPVTLGPLAKRNIFDAIRSAYDLGYNDARNARSVPGDSAPVYKGRDVEADHGGALFNTLANRLRSAATPEPVGEPVAYREKLTGRLCEPDDTHRCKFPMCYEPLIRPTPAAQAVPMTEAWFDSAMRLADAYADACFDQALNQRTEDPNPDAKREKLVEHLRHHGTTAKAKEVG